ncbi:unnamed protein product [Sympodiomycopsis kandeliae]
MGIQGLLPLLKDIQKSTHISEFKGQTLGIDGYVWLHRGAYGCAEKLVKGENTTKYVNYALHRIRLLKHHGVKPYVVFDGDRLPSKSGTEQDRHARRQENLAKARLMEQQGRQSSAFELYAKCVDVTPEMAFQLIKALRAEGVDYVVAPYEADAQLAFLERLGLIDAIVTEDSDLLVFGCQRVLFKLDSNGDCFEISRSRLTSCRSVSFAGWTSDLFRQMAILSGCDYLPSISGMGLKNAHKLLQRYKTVKKVLQAVRLEGKMRVPANYAEQFEQAEKTFIYQRVWDPSMKRLATLNPLPQDLDSAAVTYIGPEMSDTEAGGIARGEIDPISRQNMIDIAPNFRPQNRENGGSKQRATSSAHSPSKASVKTPRPKNAIDTFFQRSTVSPSKRTPLAPRDTNVRSAAVPSTQLEDSPAVTKYSPEVQTPAPLVKSKFFGGFSKAKKELSPEANQIAANINESASQESGTSVATNASGMNDFYFELDGADPQLLMGDELDDVERIPAFAAYLQDGTVATDAKVATAASFEPTQTDYHLNWMSKGSGCDSDLSSEASTTPRKRKYSCSSVEFSSPIAAEGENESPTKGLEPPHLAQERTEVGQTRTTARKRKSLDDQLSSPRGTAEADTRAGRSFSPCLRKPYATSDIESLEENKQQLPPLTGAEDLQSEEDEISQGSDEDCAATGSLSTAGRDLWARFGHTPRRPPGREPVQSHHRTMPTRLSRTPSNRPLRLYDSPSPCQNISLNSDVPPQSLLASWKRPATSDKTVSTSSSAMRQGMSSRPGLKMIASESSVPQKSEAERPRAIHRTHLSRPSLSLRQAPTEGANKENQDESSVIQTHLSLSRSQSATTMIKTPLGSSSGSAKRIKTAPEPVRLSSSDKRDSTTSRSSLSLDSFRYRKTPHG